MQIYLAARYQRYPEMQHIATKLREQGHQVTSRWIWGTYATYDATLLDPCQRTFTQTFAKHDMEDMLAADCLIGFAEEPGVISRGGRHVEWGMAVAWGKRLILIGEPEHLFHCLPQVEIYACLEDICWDDATAGGHAQQENLTGKQFQAIRKHSLHLSVKALANLLGVKPQTIHNIESGNKRCGRQMSLVMRLQQQQAERHTTPPAPPGAY